MYRGVEDCDDANDSDTDARTTTCRVARRGDGHVWEGRYAPMTATRSTTTAAPTSARRRCGDGIVSGQEECDDGKRQRRRLHQHLHGRYGELIVQRGVRPTTETVDEDAHGACEQARAEQDHADLQAEDLVLRLATTATSITATPAPTVAPPRGARHPPCRSGTMRRRQPDRQRRLPQQLRGGCRGDGAIGPGEECDDGNADNDACRNNCQRARPAWLIQAGETCDDANRIDNDACRNTCQVAACGDGVRRNDLMSAGHEACDDGNNVNTDACLNACTIARCGDSVAQEGVEACDDGNEVNTDACLNDCTAAACGDDVLRTDIAEGQDGYEACDDGNRVDTDGCRNSCVIARCGDGVVREGVEGCDDGNNVNTDACLDSALAAAATACGAPTSPRALTALK